MYERPSIDMKRAEFLDLAHSDRKAAIRRLACAMFDAASNDDLVVRWIDLHQGDAKQLYKLSDDELIALADRTIASVPETNAAPTDSVA